jgi:hypothetical protein
VSPLSGAPGETVTVSWDAAGGSAVLEALTTGGDVISTDTVDLIGSKTYVLDVSNGQGVVFRLTVRGTGRRPVTRTESVAIVCSPPWIVNPTPRSCPAKPAVTSAVTVQRFQRGTAYYVAGTEQIFFLTFRFELIELRNVWRSGIPITSPSYPIVPPYVIPQAQIGDRWRYDRWFDGRPLYEVFGGALGAAQLYTGAIQEVSPGSYFLILQDRSVVLLDNNSFRWQQAGVAQ